MIIKHQKNIKLLYGNRPRSPMGIKYDSNNEEEIFKQFCDNLIKDVAILIDKKIESIDIE